jgi:hypothetical protein
MEKTNRLIASREESTLWGARPEQILPSLRGLEIRKYPAAGEVFFLTSPFIELIGMWPLAVVLARCRDSPYRKTSDLGALKLTAWACEDSITYGGEATLPGFSEQESKVSPVSM